MQNTQGFYNYLRDKIENSTKLFGKEIFNLQITDISQEMKLWMILKIEKLLMKNDINFFIVASILHSNSMVHLKSIK